MSFSSFQDWFEVNPIVLVSGIAASFPGNRATLNQLMQTGAFSDGLNGILAGLASPSDPYFARFKPLPGSSLARNENGKYPFANQAVAANAIVVQPLNVSVLMTAPARGVDGYATKFAIMNSLRQLVAQHSALGGWYTVATPASLYDGLLLLDLIDVTDSESKQPQVHYQWVFEKPLITQSEASQVQSQLMAKITSGTQLLPNSSGQITWSGLNSAPGQTNNAATSSVIAGSGSQAVFSGSNSPSSFGFPNSQAQVGGVTIGPL